MRRRRDRMSRVVGRSDGLRARQSTHSERNSGGQSGLASLWSSSGSMPNEGGVRLKW